MTLLRKIALASAMLLAVSTAKASEQGRIEQNKALVTAFYEKALNEKDIEGAIAMMGPTYTQHNARIPDGKEGFRTFFNSFKQRYPQSHSRIVRVIAEGDLVVLHVHMVTEPGTRGTAVMDIFRVENGKLVEHWDVLQPIPDNIPHANTMF